MAFYFRKGEAQQGDNTFEWTHKSFGEYLIARRLIRLTDTLADERQRAKQTPGRGIQHPEALETLIKTTARIELNDNIKDFIASILHQNINDKTLTEEKLTKEKLNHYQTLLVDCINSALAGPLEMTQYLPGESFANLCQFEANSISCIFMLHSQIATITEQEEKEKEKLNLPHRDSFKTLYQRLTAQSNTWLFRHSLTHLTLSDQNFNGLNLNQTNFSHCLFINTHFRLSLIMYSLFKHCKLQRSYFIETKLKQVDFTHSNLTDAQFIESKLYVINFTDSQLASSDFKDIIDQGEHRGLNTCHDLHLVYNIPDDWQQYSKYIKTKERQPADTAASSAQRQIKHKVIES